MLSEAKAVKSTGGEVGGGALGDLKSLRRTNSLVSDCGLAGISGSVTVAWIGSSTAWPEQPVSASLPVSLTGSMRKTLPSAQANNARKYTTEPVRSSMKARQLSAAGPGSVLNSTSTTT